MQYEKVYIGMLLYTDADGNTKPVELEWINGTKYPISKVIERKIATPNHVGSSPTVRYTVLVKGHEKILYYEKFSKRWFVEKQL